MKRMACALILGLVLAAGCGKGEDLKKQVEQKNQILAAQEAEIKKLKDDMVAREADLKNQCEQRMQKVAAQNKQQVDALNAKVAELTKKKDAAEKAVKAETAKPAKRPASAAAKSPALSPWSRPSPTRVWTPPGTAPTGPGCAGRVSHPLRPGCCSFPAATSWSARSRVPAPGWAGPWPSSPCPPAARGPRSSSPGCSRPRPRSSRTSC